jgi:hypothetical protein
MAADLPLFALTGAAGFAMWFMLTSAYSRAQAQNIAAAEYTALIWSAMLGYFFFAEVPRWQVWAGATVVVAAVVMSAWDARQRKARGIAVAEQPGSLFAAAEASAGIAAAEALYTSTISGSMRRIEAGEKLTDLDLLTARPRHGVALSRDTLAFEEAAGTEAPPRRATWRRCSTCLAAADSVAAAASKVRFFVVVVCCTITAAAIRPRTT